MTRAELLDKICPYECINRCIDNDADCDTCINIVGLMLDKYDKHMRAEVFEEILQLPKHNHYDMCDELMYQSISVDDIKQLKEKK